MPSGEDQGFTTALTMPALMECVIGLFQTECVRTTVFHSGPFKTIADVEFATYRRMGRVVQQHPPAQ